jgi:hypothetical protein
MGQKPSQPQKEETFEYTESISFVKDSTLFKHNIKNNTSKLYYKFRKDPISRDEHDNRVYIRIAIVGNAILLVTLRRDSISFEDQYFCCMSLIDSEGKEWASKDYDIGTLTSATKWFGIDKIFESRLKVLQEIRIKLLNSLRSSSSADTLFSVDSTWFEGHDLKHFKDLLVKTPEQLQWEAINSEDIQITLGNETSLLQNFGRHIIVTGYGTHNCKTIAFDYYDNKLLTCSTVSMYYEIQWWVNNNNTWKKFGPNQLFLFGSDPETKTNYTCNVHRMIASRNYIFLQTRDKNDDCVIIVLEKNPSNPLFLKQLYRIRGTHMFYQDDHDDWLIESMKILQDVEVLRKMSCDVLAIILSFVG